MSYKPSNHAKRYLKRNKGLSADSTHKSHKIALKDFEQWCDQQGIEDLTTVDSLTIEEYVIDKDDEGLAPGTINKRYYKVKKFYDFLADKLEVIDESPFDGIDKSDLSRLTQGSRKEEETRQEITYLTPEQVDEIAENVPEPTLRNELVVRLLFETGIRKGELIGIRLEDLDRDSHSIRIKADKTNTNRTVYYRPSLDFHFNQYIDGGYRSSSMHAAESPYLFVSRVADKMSPSRVRQTVLEATKNAGIQEVLYEDAAGVERYKYNVHTLRHSHAIAAIKSGMDIERVRRHMGHADISMTQKYLQFVGTDVKDSFENNFGNW